MDETPNVRPEARLETVVGARTRSVASEKDRLQTLIGVAAMIRDGLNGNSFRWGGGETLSRRRALAQLGIELVTATQIKKRGHELIRRSQPVGDLYFGAPISRRADVYVFGVQTRPKRPNAGHKPTPQEAP